jgi:3',5'-cyclic AMP phosphodiesterase CpdA
MTLTHNPTRTILHLSDTHILPTDDDRLHGVDTMANLRRALDNVTEHGLSPDAILISGDLANSGELESYRRLRGVLDDARARFGVPVLTVMGNHDARASLREGLLGESPSDDPYHYVAWVGGLRVVVLDSTVPGAAHGELGQPQLEWLRAELVQPAPEGTLVVLHHPPIPGPVPIINYLVLQNPEALADAIQGSDVLAVLAGHAHHPICGAFAGVLCFAAPATAYTVDPLAGAATLRGIAGPGFGLVHLYGRTAVASAVALTSDAQELYTHELSPEVISQWTRRTPATPVAV